MLLSDLARIDEAYLVNLCANRCPESDTLDFKQEQPTKDDKGRADLQKDVCALANHSGGDIVYGIADVDGCADKIYPITSEGQDSLKLRILQVLDQIEPRITGLRVEPITLSTGYAMIVRVPASYEGPHCFKPNGVARRFVIRNGTTTSDLSFDQLRGAFDRTATLADKARQFVDQRIRRAQVGDTWQPMRPGPLCLAHVVPVEAFSGRRTVDVRKIYDDFSGLRFTDWRGGSGRSLNLDGVVAYAAKNDGDLDLAYTQLFRNGIFEATRVGGGLITPHKVVPSTVVTTFFREAMSRGAGLLISLGVTGPAIFQCALVNVGSYELGVGQTNYARRQAVADRPNIVLPETWVPDLVGLQNIDEVVRPLMDILWQSFGVEHCFEYNEAGEWSPRGFC